MINDARCTRDIKSMTAMVKAAFSKKKTLFICKSGLSLWKEAVKCYIWRIILYGAVNWTVRKVDQKYLGRFEMWTCRKKGCGMNG
jgi:hypothetical protein